MIPRLLGFHFLRPEYLLVELGGLLEVLDLERVMNNAIHMKSASGEW